MKRLICVCLIALSVLALTGCQPNVQEDLQAYVDEVFTLAKMEMDAVNTYHAAIGEMYKGVDQVIVAMRDFVLPEYQRFRQGLSGIKPKSEEVKELHDLILQATGKQYDAFGMSLQAFMGTDQALAERANESFNEAIAGMDEWKTKLDELVSKYEVKLPNN